MKSALMCAICLVGALAHAEGKVEFIFAYDTQQGFPAFMGEGLEVPDRYPGTYIDILREVERRLPIKLILKRLPWERCKAYLAQNRASGINSSFKPSRSLIGVFPKGPDGKVDRSKRITSDTYRFYAKKGVDLAYDPVTNRVTPADSMLAAPLGYSIVDDLGKKGIIVEQHPDGLKGLLRLLFYGRVQGVVSHESQMQFALSQAPQYAEVVKAVEPAIRQKDYYILISRGFYRENPELSKQIWTEIEDLRETLLPQLEIEYQAHFGA